MGGWEWWRWWVCATDRWYSVDPVGRRTIFWALNLAPETAHHWLRMMRRVSRLSEEDRKTMVSSTKRVTIRRSLESGILMP